MAETSLDVLEGLLPRLGFSPKTFSEVILVLKTDEGAHVQPLGVKLKGSSLWARVFKSTRLHERLRSGLKGSLNIIYDPRAFFEPIMYGHLLSLEIRNSHLGPYIASCDMAIFVRITEIFKKKDFSSVIFKPTGLLVRREHPLAHNRAFSAIVEALVHLTRIRYYVRLGDVQLVEALVDKVRTCVEAVRHATEEATYLSMASEILSEAGRWASLIRDVASLPEKGVYTLILRLREGLKIEVGSLGLVELEAGYYLYTGSALGRGASGLRKRILRHLIRPKNVFWHIDYLLNRPEARVEAIVLAGSEFERECDVNKALIEELGASSPAPGFGSSDCRSGCPAHLLYAGLSSPVEGVKHVYRRLGLEPICLEVVR